MKPYQDWEARPDQRRKNARMLFAHDLFEWRSAGLSAVKALLAADLVKKPTDKQVQIAEWARGLTNHDQEVILSLADEAVRRVLFGMLVTLDGADGGSWIAPVTTRYRLSVLIEQDDAEARTEVLELNSAEDDDLHDELYDVIAGKDPRLGL